MHKLDALACPEPEKCIKFVFPYSDFIRQNFEQLIQLRNVGFSFRNIADFLTKKYGKHVSHLSLASAWQYVKKERSYHCE